jgi:hypothetical protein
MNVYNLTNKQITYRGKDIPVSGCLNYPELDTFIPTRDMELEKKKVLAFGELPLWWRINEETKASALLAAQPRKEPVVSRREDRGSFKKSKLEG